MNALAIITIIMCIVGTVATYVPRLPAVIASYAGLVCAWAANGHGIDTTTLIFWGIAVALVLGIGYLSPYRTIPQAIAGNAYVCTGAIVGTLLGFIATPTAAAIIVGGATGAFIGALTFRQLNANLRAMGVLSTSFVNFTAYCGLRAVVACSLCGISLASIL